MSNITRKKKEISNIIDISTNKRFQPVEQDIPVYSPSNRGNYEYYELAHSFGGFLKGDKVICQTVFSRKDITPNTFVVTKDKKVAVDASFGFVLGIVVAFQREVSR